MITSVPSMLVGGKRLWKDSIEEGSVPVSLQRKNETNLPLVKTKQFLDRNGGTVYFEVFNDLDIGFTDASLFSNNLV